jgi:hypothetical protein
MLHPEALKRFLKQDVFCVHNDCGRQSVVSGVLVEVGDTHIVIEAGGQSALIALTDIVKLRTRGRLGK